MPALIFYDNMLHALAAALAFQAPEHPPSIVTLIADDFGWNNVGYHNPSKEVVTPNIDGLLTSGVELTRHYVYRFCSPSRSSFQSGRIPLHVNDRNAEPTVSNPKDPVGGFAGIPVNMTGIAQKLKSVGYRTHMTGKWDAGMATPRHSPVGRGYDSWFGYYHHANDYWSEKLPFSATGNVDVCKNRFVDLWDTDKPAWGQNGTAYEEELFLNHTLATIAAHDAAAAPLFLVHAFHLVHTPLQVPAEWEDRFRFIHDKGRRLYASMVAYMDDAIGQIVGALRAKAGLWENSLLLFTSDNGGPIYYPGSANNHPLKGGKLSDWEGGVRVNALLAGGALPLGVRGSTLDAPLHIADWYATFCALAGCDGTTDAEAEAAGLPGIDSISMWPLLLAGDGAHETTAQAAAQATAQQGLRTPQEQARAPRAQARRSEVHLSNWALIQRVNSTGQLYKLLVGWQTGSGWVGDVYPNLTSVPPVPNPTAQYPPSKIDTWAYDCDAADGGACLYELVSDPTEHLNLAAAMPQRVQMMRARLAELNTANYEPDRGKGDPQSCVVAEGQYRGFYGPWIGV